MTTGGEGGMVTTNDRALWSWMWSYKDHGKSWEAVYEREHPPGYRWLHESFGTNGRLTEIQAVIGRIQLARMPEWTRMRRDYCERIWETARALPGLRVPTVPEAVGHAGYKCYLFVEPTELAAGWDRDRVLNAVLEHEVPCFSGSCSEIYLEKCFQDAGLVPDAPLTNARELSDTSLMFLVHPTLEDSHITQTCHALEAVMAEATAQNTAARASG